MPLFKNSAACATRGGDGPGVTRQTINSIERSRFRLNLKLAFNIGRAFGKKITEVLTLSPQTAIPAERAAVSESLQ